MVIRRHRGTTAGLGLLGVLAFVLPALLALVLSAPAGAAGTLPTPGKVETGRTRKVDLIMRLKAAPQTLILGSSRALKCPPAVLRQLTGKRVFNLAISCGRPVDVWCYLQLLHDRFPKAGYNALWLLDVEQMIQGNRTAVTRVPEDLLWEPRLARYLPAALQVMPPGYRQPKDDDQIYTSAGWLKWSHYEVKERQGMTLGKWMPGTLKYFDKKYPRKPPRMAFSPCSYFTECVREFNAAGNVPVVVLSPYYTRLLDFLRKQGWDDCRADVVAWLREQQRQGLKFVLLDFSRPRSFGGDPTAFFDGYHMRNGLAATVVKAAVKRSGDALK
jgi:hypothetical protein